MKKIISFCLLTVILSTTLLLSSCEIAIGSIDLFHIYNFNLEADQSSHFMKCLVCDKFSDGEPHSFEVKSDYQNMSCTTCAYTHSEENSFTIEKNADGTVRLGDELIDRLVYYIDKEMFLQADTYSYSFAEKLNLCKSEITPLLVKLSDNSYYVAAYFAASEIHSEAFCCPWDYTWIGFQKAEDVKESWEGKKLIGAFQINPQELCVNIKTGLSDVTVEHFEFYRPKFVDGVAIAPEITFEKMLIYLSQSKENEKEYIGFSTAAPGFEKIACIELDGKCYVMQRHGAISEGELHGRDLNREYGEYYDHLMSVLVDEHHIERPYEMSIYGLFTLEDISEIIR